MGKLKGGKRKGAGRKPAFYQFHLMLMQKI